MKKKQKRSIRNSRRAFVDHGVMGAISIALGFFGARIFLSKSKSASQTVRMITSDGKIVEVEQRHLPDRSKRKFASDQEFEAWMSEEEK